MAPKSQFIQEYFRIRSGDDTALNTDAGWAAAENTNVTVSTGVPFRIRFKVRETAGGSDSTTFKLQVNRNGAGWVDVDILGGTSSPAAQAIVSSQYNDGDATTAELLTDTTTNVNGEGFEDNTSASYSLSSEETEFEFCLMLMGIHDSAVQNVAGDTLDFRIVEGDGTVFSGTYTNPTATIAETNGYIGGTYPESPNRIIETDTNRNIYCLIEASSTGALIVMMKSDDGGDTWREQDSANRPTNTDMEGADLCKDGDTLHIIHQQSGTADIRYHRFRMSDHPTNPDTWEITDEVITSAVPATDQAVAIECRSDNTLVAFYRATDAGNEDIKYKIRNGTWGTENNLDTTASVDFTGISVVKGASDLIHIFYIDHTNGDMYHKSLSSADSLSARELVHSDTGIGGADRFNIVPPVYWDDGGDEKIMVGVKDESDSFIYTSVITNDGAPAAVVQASDNTAESSSGGTSHQPVANLSIDGTDVYLHYADDATQDLHRDKNANDGGWGTDVEEIDAIEADWVRGVSFTHSSGNGGATVVGYIYDDGSNGGTGRINYSEFVIAASPQAAGAQFPETFELPVSLYDWIFPAVQADVIPEEPPIRPETPIIDQSYDHQYDYSGWQFLPQPGNTVSISWSWLELPAPVDKHFQPELPIIDETYDEEYDFSGTQLGIQEDLVIEEPGIQPNWPDIDETYTLQHNYDGWQQHPLSEDVEPFALGVLQWPVIDESYVLEHDYTGWQKWLTPVDIEDFILHAQELPQIDETYFDKIDVHEYFGHFDWLPPADIEDFQLGLEIPQIDESYDHEYDYQGLQKWLTPQAIEDFILGQETPPIDETYELEHDYRGIQRWLTPDDVEDFILGQEWPQIDETYADIYDFSGWQAFLTPDDVIEFIPLAELPLIDEAFDETLRNLPGYQSWLTPEDVEDFLLGVHQLPVIDETYIEPIELGLQSWLIPLDVVDPLLGAYETAIIDETYIERLEPGMEFWLTPASLQDFLLNAYEIPVIDETYIEHVELGMQSWLIERIDEPLPFQQLVQIDDTYTLIYDYSGWTQQPLVADAVLEDAGLGLEIPIIDQTYDLVYDYSGWQYAEVHTAGPVIRVQILPGNTRTQTVASEDRSTTIPSDNRSQTLPKEE